MNPNRAAMDSFQAGITYEKNRRNAQRAQSRAAQPKRKNNRKASR